MVIGLSEAIAALLGACATGIFGIHDRRSERLRRRKALTAEVVAHTKFLTHLIRDQGYLTMAEEVVEATKGPEWDSGLLHIMPRLDYLHGIRATVEKAGELDSESASLLVEFVHRCTLFLDSTDPDERYLANASIADKRSHAEETLKNIRKLLAIGDQLVQLNDR